MPHPLYFLSNSEYQARSRQSVQGVPNRGSAGDPLLLTVILPTLRAAFLVAILFPGSEIGVFVITGTGAAATHRVFLFFHRFPQG